jgi:hypothetical protein
MARGRVPLSCVLVFSRNHVLGQGPGFLRGLLSRLPRSDAARPRPCLCSDAHSRHHYYTAVEINPLTMPAHARAIAAGAERAVARLSCPTELCQNLRAMCLTAGLRSQELRQAKLCLGHIKSLALAVRNEQFHFHNMLVSLSYMPFDICQQKQSFVLGGHGCSSCLDRREHNGLSATGACGRGRQCR